jgi:hypothetical protein
LWFANEPEAFDTSELRILSYNVWFEEDKDVGAHKEPEEKRKEGGGFVRREERGWEEGSQLTFFSDCGKDNSAGGPHRSV